MNNFYDISKKEKKDGYYHIHGFGCKVYDNKVKKYKGIGLFQNSLEAIAVARKIHPNIKACKECCPSYFKNEKAQ